MTRAERFKRAALIIGMRQQEPLANLLGCGPDYVSRIMCGAQEPGCHGPLPSLEEQARSVLAQTNEPTEGE